MPDRAQFDLFVPADAGKDAVPPANVSADLRLLAARLPGELRLGTSSWSFPGWAGLVYGERATEQVLARDGLGAYARHPLLRAVGIDRSFYAPLPAADYRRYALATPTDFRFIVKAHGAVTTPVDQLARRSPVVLGPERFLDAEYTCERIVAPVLEGLAERLGILLFQFPPLELPQLRDPKRFAARLHQFLGALPRGPQYAVEVRNRELLGPAYADALACHGATHCFSVHPRLSSLPAQAAAVGENGWLSGAVLIRWMLHPAQDYEGARDRYFPFDRLVDPDPRSRAAVAEFTELLLARGMDTYVIANNKAEGSAPLTLAALARELDRRGGLPARDGAS
jgi:uncharacterized protein YecE (DUF72 family)